MNTSLELEESYSRLKDKLSELFSNQDTQFIQPQKGDYPILVLESSMDSAGFAIVNGSAESSYSSAYKTFKDLYREKHDTWKERNLSFTVCSQGDINKNESLFRSIESDVYFCKKYIVNFSKDPKDLEKELLGLPFLPLKEHYANDTERPISAQSLLQDFGVSATLSRHIIVSGLRVAKGIIDDCIERSHQLPKISTTAISTSKNFNKTLSKTRIKNISIEGFRAYNKKREFNLDADIVVIYGQNGLGKTSLFDAIDYVTTGRIGRFHGHYRTAEIFQKIVQNLDCKIPGKIAIDINQDDSDIHVQRHVNDWNIALFDDEKLDRWNALQKITSANWQEKRIDIQERLFRATHLFSQSNPELLSDFEGDSKLSFEIVSRALALEDYASGLSKVNEILSVLAKYIDEEIKSLNELRNEIEILQDRRDRLPDSKKEEVGPKLKKMITELQYNVEKNIEIEIDKGSEITKEVIREWRSLIDAKLENTRQSFKKIQKIEAEYPHFLDKKKDLDQKKYEQKEISTQREKHLAEKVRLEKELERTLLEIQELENSLNKIRSESRALSELKQLKEIADGIVDNIKKHSDDLVRVDKEYSDLDKRVQILTSDLDKLGIRQIELKDDITRKLRRIQTLSEIRKGWEPWKKSINRSKELEKLTVSLNSELNILKDSIEEHGKSIKKFEKEYFEATQKLEKFNSNTANLSSLLDKIEDYVQSGFCPTCGTDHESKETLLQRIREQKDRRPLGYEEVLTMSQNLKKSIDKHKDQLIKLKHDQGVKSEELKQLNDELTKNIDSIKEFEVFLERENISIDKKQLDEIGDSLEQEQKAIDNLKSELNKIKAIESKSLKEKAELELRYKQLVEQGEYLNSKMETLRKQLESFYSKSEVLGIPLNIKNPDFSELQSKLEIRESELTKKLGVYQNKEVALTGQIKKTEDSSNKKLKDLESLISRIGVLESELQTYEESINEFSIEKRRLQNISEFRREKEEVVNKLQQLALQALTLERALESAERSAMVAELDSNIKMKSHQKSQVKKKIDKYSELKEWFLKVREVLNKQSSNAVKNHVFALGPLSSLIQKRLRTVYGFGDISLTPEGNEIRVEVERNGVKMKPTDYFSDSQKQILMLSLFLSGRLTQTWSGFAPILLDDPVTHFDDLNAFGFIELIRGLVTGSPGQRQFIISTCEERLFDVMRRKFENIEGGAHFYRFSGINRDGPIISS